MKAEWLDVVTEAVNQQKNSKRDEPFILAIDGQSASGKTTLGEKIAERYGGNLFHMDDFFLQPAQRTGKRLSEIGGNVDYERFAQVLSQIKEGKEIEYQVYNCKKQCLGEQERIRPVHWNIVEGSYSMHPYFGDCYDLKIVVTIDREAQKERILERNGREMLPRFLEEWIPKENEYLNAFQIFEKADIILK